MSITFVTVSIIVVAFYFLHRKKKPTEKNRIPEKPKTKPKINEPITQMDCVVMQLDCKKHGSSQIEGIVVEKKEDGMMRVIAVGTEIDIPGSMLVKS